MLFVTAYHPAGWSPRPVPTEGFVAKNRGAGGGKEMEIVA